MASELCTVVDDGTMVDRRGSVAIDDEGTPGQYNVLIETALLKATCRRTGRVFDGDGTPCKRSP
ncbi:metallopeptidase TldD-related protein [Shigella flexneri]